MYCRIKSKHGDILCSVFFIISIENTNKKNLENKSSYFFFKTVNNKGFLSFTFRMFSLTFLINRETIVCVKNKKKRVPESFMTTFMRFSQQNVAVHRDRQFNTRQKRFLL